jgi:transposase-like protein
MASTIAGECVWIWRAGDDEGEVMDTIVQKRCDTGAAVRFL